jgi:ComF family protein
MRIFKDIFHLFFPDICFCCDKVLTTNEKSICITCRHELPETNYTFQKDNPLEKIFYGRTKIEAATSLLFFHKKGIVQKLIHNLKYKGHQEIGILLGEWLGEDLKKSHRYANIDYIIPVPLHKKRLKERGYNQVEKFGITLSKALEKPYINDVLIRRGSRESQTKKRRTERFSNTNELFYLTNAQTFENKHILILDDIITTGATIDSCANELLKTKNIKISVAVMAFTL